MIIPVVKANPLNLYLITRLIDSNLQKHYTQIRKLEDKIMDRFNLLRLTYLCSSLFYLTSCGSTYKPSHSPIQQVIMPESLAAIDHWLSFNPMQPSQYNLNQQQSTAYNAISLSCKQKTLPDWLKKQLMWVGEVDKESQYVSTYIPHQNKMQVSWPISEYSPMIDLSEQQLNSTCALISVKLALANYSGAVYLDLSNNHIDDALVEALVSLLRSDKTSRSIQINLLGNDISDRSISTLIKYQKENPERLFNVREIDQTTFISSTIQSLKKTTKQTHQAKSVVIDLEALSSDNLLVAMMEKVVNNKVLESLTIKSNNALSENTLLIIAHTQKHLTSIHSLTLNLPKASDADIDLILKSVFSTSTNTQILDLSHITIGPKTQLLLSSETIKSSQLIVLVSSLSNSSITTIIDKHPSWIVLNRP